MNVEKLHSLLTVIKHDFDSHKIISKFSDFTWKMSLYVEDPSDENSESFKSALDDLNSGLEEFSCNDLVPSKRIILKQLNGTDLVGHGLRRSIENILSTNATIQADISQQLTDLLSSVNRFYERSADIIRGLSHFDIKQDHLNSDEFELGFIYPADQFSLTLAKFKNEIIFINKLLSNIYETTGEQSPAADIRSLNSGDIAIFLRTPVTIAYKIMQLIKGIVNVYDAIGDIQQKSKELKLLEVSQNIIDLLKEEEKQRITVGLEKLKSNLFDRSNGDSNSGIDDGRMNELENSISIDLKQLAQKIEHGLKIEVSVPSGPLLEEETLDGVNVRQLADLGRLMTSSAFTHEPVLLLSGDKAQPASEQEPDSSQTASPEELGEKVANESKSVKKKKAAVKKKKLEPNEEIPIGTNIDIEVGDEPEFNWEISDD